MALLWGLAESGRRGPKPRHSVDEVVRAAIALADAEGLAALSVRRVAETLGLSPMSLYTYVPSKSELVDLMLDRVAEEIAPPDAADWRGRLEQLARRRWDMAQRHPWLMQVGMHRPPLGPHVLAAAESALKAIDGLGLTELEMDQLTSAIGDYVRGAIRSVLDAREIEQLTGMSDEQWWAMNQPLLQDLVDPARYPMIVRIGEAYKAGVITPDHERNFEFGLQRMLDGIAAFIERRKAETA
ncbi:MAG TPA: TetR/AcrR family transcriptional regulator [Phenylobacterium sp.]|jgi:AcrR family transcriptional regulator